MKTLILIAILFSTSSFQQEKVPFKGANQIIINTNLSGDDAFTRWGKQLSQNGYFIDKSNKDFLNLETSPRDTKRYNFEYKVLSAINGSGVIKISIKWRQKSNIIAGTQGTDFYEWEYAKANGNVQKIIYDELIEVINSLENIEIYYNKK